MHPILVRFAPHIIIALILGGAVVAIYAYAYGKGRDAERARWDAANVEAASRFQEALAEQQATVAQLDADLRRARARKTEQREALSDAIATNPDWSSVAIPDGVRAALERDREMPADPRNSD